MNLEQCNKLEVINNDFYEKLKFQKVSNKILELLDPEITEYEDQIKQLDREMVELTDTYYSTDAKVRTQKKRLASNQN